MISWILYYSEALSPLFSIKKAVENYTLTSVFDTKEHFIFSFYVVYKSSVPTIHLWHPFLKKNSDFGNYGFGFVVGELFNLGIVEAGIERWKYF